MFFESLTSVRMLQPLNALCPILVTLSGIVMLVRLLQPLNALCPILVRPLSGIVMLVKLVHATNA